MPIPPSARAVYKKNPISEVVCQLRFPPILAIDANPPAAFQEKVREGYPLYIRGEGPEGFPPQFAKILAQLPLPIGKAPTTHKFLREDSQRFISLTSEFVAVTEKQYTRWEHYRNEITLAKIALEEIYRPAFYARIGLRYQDTIDKTALGLGNRSWKYLLHPALSGLLGSEDLADDVQETQTQSVVRLHTKNECYARVRHGLVKGSKGQTVFRFDTDLFTQERTEWDEVLNTLEALHGLAGNLFRWAIGPELAEGLGPEPIPIE